MNSRKVERIELEPGHFVLSTPGSAPNGDELRECMHAIALDVRARVAALGIQKAYDEEFSTSRPRK